MTDRDRITMQNVKIVYRNFSGLAGQYNEAGDRNFCVVLGEELARQMEADGWNIRWQPPYEEGDPMRPILKVRVKYRTRDGRPTRPPKVILITSRGKNILTERQVMLLDLADIIETDLIINPYEYERGKFTAYLDSIFVTIRENELELKYADVPDSALSAMVPAENQGAPF